MNARDCEIQAAMDMILHHIQRAQDEVRVARYRLTQLRDLPEFDRIAVDLAEDTLYRALSVISEAAGNLAYYARRAEDMQTGAAYPAIHALMVRQKLRKQRGE